MITKKQRTALHEPASVTFVGLVAGTAVGSTDTSILRWITAAQTVVGAYFTVTDSATLGTTILITTPGHYLATVMLPRAGSSRPRTWRATMHSESVLEPPYVFAPIREDWANGTDDYLRHK